MSNETDSSLRYGIYGRFSSDNQSDKSSKDQIRECQEYIEKQNGKVAKVYKDDAHSAATDHRPDYQRLLCDIRDRKFDILIAESLSRLSRKQTDIHKLKELLTFYKVKIVTLHEGEDISEMVWTFKGLMNEQYRKDLIAATKRGLRGRAMEGIYIGRPPYGYELLKELDPMTGERIRGVLVRDEERLALVHRMFEMFNDGFSPQHIAKTFNSENISARDVNKWSPSTIRTILKNPTYIGQIVWNKKSVYKDPEEKRTVVRQNPEEEWVVTENENLRAISQNLWLSVQSRMQEINSQWKERCPNNPLTGKKQNKYMLSGLIKCGECGGNYAVTSKDRFSCSAHKRHHGCKNGRTVVRQVLENSVIDLLINKILTVDNIERFLQSYKDSVETLKQDLDADNAYTRKKIKKVEKQIEALMAAILRGVVTDTTQSYLKELEQEKAILEASVFDHPVINIPDEKVIADFRTLLSDIAGNLDNEEHYRKAMNFIRPLIDKIVIHPKEDGNRAEVHGKIARALDLRADENGNISFRVESDIAQQPYGNSAISESIIMMTFIPQKWGNREER